MVEPESLVLRLLQDMRAEMSDMRGEMATKGDIARLDSNIADLGSEVRSLRADVASDLISLERRLGDQLTSLRRSVIEYHSTAVGHGLLYSEIEERVRRIEQHLKLDPPGAH